MIVPFKFHFKSRSIYKTNFTFNSFLIQTTKSPKLYSNLFIYSTLFHYSATKFRMSANSQIMSRCNLVRRTVLHFCKSGPDFNLSDKVRFHSQSLTPVIFGLRTFICRGAVLQKSLRIFRRPLKRLNLSIPALAFG